MSEKVPPQGIELWPAAQFHWAEAMKYVGEGLKARFLLNGGATVAILTFVGNENSGDDRLVVAVFCFAVAALLAPVAFFWPT